MRSRVSGFWRAICDSVGRAVVVDDEVVRLLAIARAGTRACPDRGRPRASARRCWHGPSAAPRDGPSRASRAHRTCSRATSSAQAFSRVAASGSSPARSSPTSCWWTRSTARRPARSQPCWRRWRKATCRSRARREPLPDPFLVLATENPIELEGTFALPEAQLDRFLVRIRLGYPSRVDEARIARRYRDSAEPLDAVTMVAPPEQTARDARSGANRRRQRPGRGLHRRSGSSDPGATGAAAGRQSPIEHGPVSRDAGVAPTSPVGTSPYPTTSRRWSRPCWDTGSSWTSIASSADRRSRA